MEACLVTGNHAVGVFATGDGTTVALLNTAVSETQTIEDGTWGRGISVQGGATLRAETCAVTENHEVGVVATAEGTSPKCACRDDEYRPGRLAKRRATSYL